jgi:REP element-mobilizing transposase RayT
MASPQYLIKYQNEPHFLTLNVAEWIDLFTHEPHRQVIVDALNFCVSNKDLSIYAWCLMHNQLLLVAKARHKGRLSAILRDFKKFTAKKLLHYIVHGKESRKLWLLRQLAFISKHTNRITYFKVWQDGGTAQFLDTWDLQQQAVTYIHNQPVFAKLVDQPKHYIFSSARDYAGYSGAVKLSSELVDTHKTQLKYA